MNNNQNNVNFNDLKNNTSDIYNGQLFNNSNQSINGVIPNNQIVNNNQFSNYGVVEPVPVKVTNLVNENIVSNNINDVINSDDKKERVLLIKEKAKNKSEFSYDDGIDTFTEKLGIKDILLNKKFLFIVMILIFICVCILVVKTFYLREKVDTYEEFFTVIEEKQEEYVRVYEGEEIDAKILKKVAASELINCINSKIETEELPDSINNIINEINNYYNQSNNYFAFKYRDIFTGFSVSYNENQNIFTASTIKAPKDIYLYEMASIEGDRFKSGTYLYW